MKRVLWIALAALLLCACGDEPTVSQEVTREVSQAVSEETESSCEHRYGDEPVEIVGNLYVYECADCGERKVVPQGTPIGGN